MKKISAFFVLAFLLPAQSAFAEDIKIEESQETLNFSNEEGEIPLKTTKFTGNDKHSLTVVHTPSTMKDHRLLKSQTGKSTMEFHESGTYFSGSRATSWLREISQNGSSEQHYVLYLLPGTEDKHSKKIETIRKRLPLTQLRIRLIEDAILTAIDHLSKKECDILNISACIGDALCHGVSRKTGGNWDLKNLATFIISEKKDMTIADFEEILKKETCAKIEGDALRIKLRK